MVFNAAQNTAFFTGPTQMALSEETRLALENEGIVMVADVAEFDDDGYKLIQENLRRPGGRIQDPQAVADAAAAVAAGNAAPPIPMINAPGVPFSAKSHHRLMNTAKLIRFYVATNRTYEHGDVMWNPIGKNFSEQWKVLMEKKDKEPNDVPKISKSLPIIKWMEPFRDHCSQIIGARDIPLYYVIRPEATADATEPDRAQHQPYSVKYGSIEEDLIYRSSQNHHLFKEDDRAVYFLLEEATRGT